MHIARRADLFPMDMLVGLALYTTGLHYSDFDINCMPVVPQEVNNHLYHGGSPCHFRLHSTIRFSIDDNFRLNNILLKYSTFMQYIHCQWIQNLTVS